MNHKLNIPFVLLATAIISIACLHLIASNRSKIHKDNKRGILGTEILNDACVGVCETPTPTPTVTPTATPTAAPTATPPSGCNINCGSSSDCNSDLRCYNNRCRHPNCHDETGCTCPTAAPTTTATPTARPTLVPILFPFPFPAPLPSEKLIIYGLGPVASTVRLTGIAVEESTLSNQQGYFEFNNLSFPTALSYLVGNLYPELCLQAIDTYSRITQPTCIPPLPMIAISKRIGPVILPPTISLDKGNILKGEQIRASGITTPNSEVEIYLAYTVSRTDIFTIVKSAFAKYIPIYNIASNSEGKFEFNLPSDSPNTWRVFSSSKVLGLSSPKSNTLTFNILPSYLRLLALLLYLLGLLRPYVIYIVIFIQLLLIVFLTHKMRGKKRRINN